MNIVLTHVLRKMWSNIWSGDKEFNNIQHRNNITLDTRFPFPNSVGGIFPGPATTQKVHQGIEWFSQLAGLQQLTILSM